MSKVKPKATTQRRPLVAKVQIAKKQMSMADDDYRAILLRITGLHSSAKCSDAQLVSVIAEFRRLGWSDPNKHSDDPQIRMVHALWADLGPFLTTPGKGGLRAYCYRMTRVQDPEWLDGKQANIVIEGLKSWLARAQATARGQS